MVSAKADKGCKFEKKKSSYDNNDFLSLYDNGMHKCSK